MVHQTRGLLSHVEQAIEKYMATEKPHYPQKEAKHPLLEGFETWKEYFEFKEARHPKRWGVCHLGLWHGKGHQDKDIPMSKNINGRGSNKALKATCKLFDLFQPACAAYQPSSCTA